MSDTAIRKAHSGDIPEIQRLYRQLDRYHADLLPQVFKPIDGDARGNDVVQEWIDRDDADYLLAELNGNVVGFLNVQQSAHPGFPMFRRHEYAMIENAVVDSPYRGRGIGTALFNAAMAWAKAHGIRYVQTSMA